MRRLPLCFLLIAAAVANGCALRPTVDFSDNTNFAGQINSHFAKIQTDYFKNLGTDNITARQKRDELIHDAMTHIDDAYGDFVTDLTAGRNTSNFIADVVELGTSAAVGITSGVRTLQILGVALTGFKGTRRSVDLNFYKEQSTPVLINKMDDNRAKVNGNILIRKKESVDTYPIKEAISDIVAYYNAGTLVRAFTELQKDTAAQAKKSEETLQELKGVLITPEATKEARDLSVKAGTILAHLFNDLKDPTKKDEATAKLRQIVVALEKNKEAADSLKKSGASSQDKDGNNLYTALRDIKKSAALVNSPLANTFNQAIVENGQE